MSGKDLMGVAIALAGTAIIRPITRTRCTCVTTAVVGLATGMAEMAVRRLRLAGADERLNRDGPFRKFYLVKRYGALLREAGFSAYELRAFSCAKLEEAIIPLLKKSGGA